MNYKDITNQKWQLYPVLDIIDKKKRRILSNVPPGALLGTRTLDPLIKSQLLYQLS